MQLNDLSPMPFGMYKGKPMQDVKVDWLHWYWNNCIPKTSEQLAVMDYIKRSLSALKQEKQDLIWDKR